MYLYIHCGGILSCLPNGHDANGYGPNLHNANMNHRRKLQHFKIDNKTTSPVFFISETSKTSNHYISKLNQKVSPSTLQLQGPSCLFVKQMANKGSWFMKTQGRGRSTHVVTNKIRNLIDIV